MTLTPTIVGLLAALVLVTAWLAIEVYRLRSGLQPLLDSSLARVVGSI